MEPLTGPHLNLKSRILSHIAHLEKDRKFRKILQAQDPMVLEKRKKVYLRLCSSIMSQQLSTKVARVIYARFLNIYGDKEPTAKQILDTPFDKLRAIGLSNAKTHYIHNVCQFFIENNITDERLARMTDQEVIEELTKIKGVGKWTVQMILMFTLGREDIFAIDDLGIQQAIAKLYQLEATNKKLLKEKMLEISSKWAPYRTYACRYLWNWKDL